MKPTAQSLLPLKPLVFDVLLALTAGERHGWDLVREIQARVGGGKILPANFYRTLRGMLADGLIEDSPDTRIGDDPRRRYFQLTTLGNEALRLEARRLEALVAESRARRVLPGKSAR